MNLRTAPAEQPEATGNPWVVGRLANGVPRLRLLCLPHAGGSAGSFAPWRPVLPAGFELVPVELPGHGTRAGLPYAASVAELVAGLLDALAGELAVPYAVFGHSFGALLALEFALEAGRRGLPAPAAVLVSAARPPQLAATRERPQTDAELTAWLRATGGLPAELLRHTEYVGRVLATIRSDLGLVERHVWPAPRPLPFPLHVLGGRADPVVSPAELEEWAEYEGPDLTITVHPGGHFYLFEQPGVVLTGIAATLTE
ncbi:Thioesterase [Kitasatospora sp. MMS16-BH015]|uniref:thioesterase II family protein n=1 Tax=Kitasatospora sp. MMS16-BH015 TaxID=2018025 RepID=UPI000CA0CE47|nr:alpha/beta fold hydrolase [Kitasatospora sp. MMS16-BH015]AUG75707.1 Thioesterase [Kitasatospora sp. MMS16-BH015]